MKTPRASIDSDHPRPPRWLQVGYTLFLTIWIPIYWVEHGPANFLWYCDFANLAIGVAMFWRGALLFSSQAVGVLLIQLIWIVDFGGALVFGVHPIGGTEYMFDATKPLYLRSLSLFHVFVPAILVWALWRFGYDRRAWKLQTLFVWALLPLSFLADPERNLNWLWIFFGVPQTAVPPVLFLLLRMISDPLILILSTHLLLRRLLPPPTSTA